MRKIKLYPIFVCFWLTLALVVMLAPNAFADWQAQTPARSISYATATMPAPSSVSAQGTCTYGTWGGPGKQCSGSQEISYYCPSGTTLSGTECVSPAGVEYVCSYGSYNGSECVGSAEVSYYCPSGTTLSGSECVSNPTSYILSWIAPSGTDALGKPLVASQQIISMPYNGSTCTTPWTPINSVGASITSATVGSPSSSECYSVQAVGRNGIWTSGVPNGVVG